MLTRCAVLMCPLYRSCLSRAQVLHGLCLPHLLLDDAGDGGQGPDGMVEGEGGTAGGWGGEGGDGREDGIGAVPDSQGW